MSVVSTGLDDLGACPGKIDVELLHDLGVFDNDLGVYGPART